SIDSGGRFGVQCRHMLPINESSRRHFLQTSLAAGAAAMTFPSIGNAADLAIEVEELRVISQQPEYYHGWPTVTRLASGELIAVWSGRREAHVCPFGTVEMMRSR